MSEKNEASGEQVVGTKDGDRKEEVRTDGGPCVTVITSDVKSVTSITEHCPIESIVETNPNSIEVNALCGESSEDDDDAGNAETSPKTPFSNIVQKGTNAQVISVENLLGSLLTCVI